MQTATAETTAIKVSADFSSSTSYVWSNAPDIYADHLQIKTGEANTCTIDLFLDANTGATGSIDIVAILGYTSKGDWFQLKDVLINVTNGQRVGNLLKY